MRRIKKYLLISHETNAQFIVGALAVGSCGMILLHCDHFRQTKVCEFEVAVRAC